MILYAVLWKYTHFQFIQKWTITFALHPFDSEKKKNILKCMQFSEVHPNTATTQCIQTLFRLGILDREDGMVAYLSITLFSLVRSTEWR